MATLGELQELRQLWFEAQKAVTTGQNYSVEGISVSRVDAEFIVKRLQELDRDINALMSPNSRTGVMTPKWT